MVDAEVDVELEVRSSSVSGSGKEIGNSLLKVRISENMPECEAGTDLIISAQLNCWSILWPWMQLLQYNCIVCHSLYHSCTACPYTTHDQWCKASA